MVHSPLCKAAISQYLSSPKTLIQLYPYPSSPTFLHLLSQGNDASRLWANHRLGGYNLFREIQQALDRGECSMLKDIKELIKGEKKLLGGTFLIRVY